MIALYDPDIGGYVYADPGNRICVAREGGRSGKHLCGAPADVTAAGVDLCRYHANHLSKWKYFEEPEERVRAKTEQLREADAEYEAAVRESEAHREKINAAASLVYYIRRTSDGAVKIGTTRKFNQRMSALRGEFGELQWRNGSPVWPLAA